MAKFDKLLERMRGNPRGDWAISDVQAVCRHRGIDCRRPSSGSSHVTLSHPDVTEILTIPFNRPIKPVYIRKLVAFVDAVAEGRSDDRSELPR